MRPKFGLSVLVIVCGGCLFGGGEESNGAPNNTTAGTNNTTAGSNNTTAGSNNVTTAPNNTTADMGQVDMGIADMGEPGSYPLLEAAEVPCAAPVTLFYEPPDTNAINETSIAALGSAPRVIALPPVELGAMSLALATKVDAGVNVLAGAFDLGVDGELVPVAAAGDTIAGASELREVYVSGQWYVQSTDQTPARIITVTLLTDIGAFECGLTLDATNVAALDCAPLELGTALAAAGLPSLSRVDFAPILRAEDNAYFYELVGSRFVAVGSGGTSGQQHVFAFQTDGVDAPSQVSLGELPSSAPDPALFFERTAFGVEPSSFGFPLILAVRPDAARGPVPMVLKAADGFGSSYQPVDRGAWSVSPRIALRPGRFTFVDSYDVTANLVVPLDLRVRVRVTNGQLAVGYAGIDGRGDALIFSRPGGFAGSPFVEHPLEASAELAAFKNVPLGMNDSGRSGLAVIHGSERDKLAIFDWNVELSATWLVDALAPGFTAARSLRAPWFVADRGAIAMIADRGTTPVVAVVPVPDINDLGQTCQ